MTRTIKKQKGLTYIVKRDRSVFAASPMSNLQVVQNYIIKIFFGLWSRSA
jgi:hypothetical protein